MTDHETHHAGVVVFCRPGDQRKAAAHLVTDEVAVGSTRCRRTLAMKDAEAIPMPLFVGNGFAERRPQRADLAAVVFVPIESIVHAGGAEDFLRILECAIIVPIH
ncbi:hypothetical protein D9M69_521070 [compost metagenome]